MNKKTFWQVRITAPGRAPIQYGEYTEEEAKNICRGMNASTVGMTYSVVEVIKKEK